MKNQKYIVEAPIPKPGQTVSSGGIREKGRITVQYSNPIPYKEPTQCLIINYSRQKTCLIQRYNNGHIQSLYI
jgi:hypothetical protein